jgi:hypothetical protein
LAQRRIPVAKPTYWELSGFTFRVADQNKAERAFKVVMQLCVPANNIVQVSRASSQIVMT